MKGRGYTGRLSGKKEGKERETEAWEDLQGLKEGELLGSGG